MSVPVTMLAVANPPLAVAYARPSRRVAERLRAER
jgi:hypothetical protein